MKPRQQRLLVFTLRIGCHNYAWQFDPALLDDLLKSVGKWAADPELPEFTWHSAAIVSQAMRRRVAELSQ